MTDIPSLLADLNRIEAEAHTLTQNLSDEQMNWRPAAQSWSIAQCLGHLERTNTIYVTSLRTGLSKSRPAPAGPLRPGFFGRIFLRALAPPVKRKVSTPAAIIPENYIAKEVAISGFMESLQATRALIRDSGEVDWNRVVIRNPFFGMLRIKGATALLAIAVHNRRHLWQADRVRRCFSA